MLDISKDTFQFFQFGIFNFLIIVKKFKFLTNDYIYNYVYIFFQFIIKIIFYFKNETKNIKALQIFIRWY